MKKTCLIVLLAALALLLLACGTDVCEHIWGEPVITESGDKIYTCTICSTTKTEAHEHEWGDPTVNAVGDTVYTCSKCQATKTEPHEHVYLDTYASDLAEHWHPCAVKGCYAMHQPESHEWNAGTVTKKPTEDKKGERTYACVKCGLTRKEEINKLPIKMPRTEWEGAFIFENLRVEYVYRGKTPEHDYGYDYLIDHGLAQIVVGEEVRFIYLDLVLPRFDLSDYYDAFVNNGQGIYTAERIEVNELSVLVDVRVIFKDGILDSVAYAYEDETGVRHEYSFTDRDEIEIAPPVLDADELAAAFDSANFDNYTVDTSATSAELALLYTETWMFDGANFGRHVIDGTGNVLPEYGTAQNAGWAKFPELAFLAMALDADSFIYSTDMNAFEADVRYEDFVGTDKDVVGVSLTIEEGYLTYLLLEYGDGSMVSYYFTLYGVTEILTEI